MAEAKKRGRGRPAGVRYPHGLKSYGTEEDVAILKTLARLRDVSEAALIRLLIREEGARQGVDGPTALAAMKAAPYYASAEVQAWEALDTEYVEEGEGEGA